MSRIAEVSRGMRVLTPMGRVARVEGTSVHAGLGETRVVLTYLDCADQVVLQASLLRRYTGPAVIFPDEREAMRKKYAGGR